MSVHDLGARAEDNLRFIRHTMETATRFTAVSGWGGMGMGVVGTIAALVAASYPTGSPPWILTWLAAAALAAPVGAGCIWWKSVRTGAPISSTAARKFALCFFPVLLAGAIVTWVLIGSAPTSLPAIWLALYGAAIMAGGAFSVPILPALGAGFLALAGAAAMFPAFSDVALLLGFGVLQIGFGAYLAARYDG